MKVQRDVVPPDRARGMSRAVRALRLQRIAPTVRELEHGTPSVMFYEKRFRPHRWCMRSCAPLCAFARSLPGRCHTLIVRAYVRGSHGVPVAAGSEVEWRESEATTLFAWKSGESRSVDLRDEHEPLYVVSAMIAE